MAFVEQFVDGGAQKLLKSGKILAQTAKPVIEEGSGIISTYTHSKIVETAGTPRKLENLMWRGVWVMLPKAKTA